MGIIRTITLLCGFIAFASNADNYGVQIGSYQNPDRDSIEDQVPDDIGELHTATTASGLIQFRVESFATLDEAEDALERLRDAGFDDAFIRRHRDSPEGSNASLEARDESNSERDDSALLSSLSEEDRRSVVYLDGRLHRKVGDEFIPLEDALEQ